MPPKGFKKPVQTRCETCGHTLPAHALRGLLRQLSEMRAELSQPRPDGDDPGRFARFRILHVQGMLDMLIEDESSFCFGHEKKGAKPGPKPRPVDAPDPAAGVPKQRRKRGPAKLQAVE